MQRIKILYLSGIVLIGILTVFIYSQILNPAASPAPGIEHYTVVTDEKSLIGFKIHNKGMRDWSYTFAIFVDDSKLTGDSPVFIKANQTFQYSMELPKTEGRVNVLIYRGEEKTLIENKTYYLGSK